jgi:hypothetical protein
MPPGELWPSIPPTYIVRLASMPAAVAGALSANLVRFSLAPADTAAMFL